MKHRILIRDKAGYALVSGFVLVAALGGALFGSKVPRATPIPSNAGSAQAQILFCIGMHIEPFGSKVSPLVDTAASFGGSQPQLFAGASKPRGNYNDPNFFRLHLGFINEIVRVVEKHHGKLTVQAQTPLSRVAAEKGEDLFRELSARRHEIALHFHEEPHLGKNCNTLPEAIWTAVMKEEIGWIEKAGGRLIRFWSGGNLYPHLLEAASQAGLEVMSDYKNPKTQTSDPRLLAVNPWRPAGGPSAQSLDAFVRHDPKGPIIYLPDGVFADDDFRKRKIGGDAEYFEAMTEGLELSLRAARQDRVNVFHLTVHPGEFRGERGQKPFEVVDRWLSEVVDPLVRDGRVKWATFGEMAEAFRAWEKSHPGVDPRSASQSLPGADAARNSGRPAVAAQPDRSVPGYMTFAVNIHDWVHPDESADTILKLIGLFRGAGVKGDFYFTAPLLEVYAAKRPDVLTALQTSGMTVSYHVRPPSPLYTGFDASLRDLSDAALARAVRDNETYALDLRTGRLDKSRPGGYSYAARFLGRPPVVVSPQCGSLRIRNAIEKVYREMGAKMVVLYHETETKIEDPFEFRNGLLIRPSDFSITRWRLSGESEDSFWWNRVGREGGAAFNPLARLQAELAKWTASRAPFITSLIHENNFVRSGPEAWRAYYFKAPQYRVPARPPYNLNAPDPSRTRPKSERDAIWNAYTAMVKWAAAHLRVVTSEDIVAMAAR
ncbi:MAG: polysaccharide deacetylase family protein [Candidatus Aminicenantes bacterium]|nr:polysaccharide deacetylase family protein [Candidatus Aminicenantes bacterium]